MLWNLRIEGRWVGVLGEEGRTTEMGGEGSRKLLFICDGDVVSILEMGRSSSDGYELEEELLDYPGAWYVSGRDAWRMITKVFEYFGEG